MTDPRAYAETTKAITITVEPFYLDEQSEPDDGHYVWAYHCLLYTSPSPRDRQKSRMPSSA